MAAGAPRAGYPAAAGRVAADHLRRCCGRRPDRPRTHPPRPRAAPEVRAHPAQRAVQRGLGDEPGHGRRRGRLPAVLRGSGVAAGAGRPGRGALARRGLLTGIRLRGQAMAEARVEALLENALDHDKLRLAKKQTLAALARAWNAPDSRLRNRLIAAMTRR